MKVESVNPGEYWVTMDSGDFLKGSRTGIITISTKNGPWTIVPMPERAESEKTVLAEKKKRGRPFAIPKPRKPKHEIVDLPEDVDRRQEAVKHYILKDYLVYVKDHGILRVDRQIWHVDLDRSSTIIAVGKELEQGASFPAFAIHPAIKILKVTAAMRRIVNKLKPQELGSFGEYKVVLQNGQLKAGCQTVDLEKTLALAKNLLRAHDYEVED